MTGKSYQLADIRLFEAWDQTGDNAIFKMSNGDGTLGRASLAFRSICKITQMQNDARASNMQAPVSCSVSHELDRAVALHPSSRPATKGPKMDM